MLRNSGQEAMVPTGGAREIETKQLELLHEMAPSAQTIGFLINATNPYVELDVQDVAAASDRLRRKLVVLRVAIRNDLEQTFATVEDRGVSALIRASDPFLCGQRDQVIALANEIASQNPLKSRG
jgi:putative ABC transport system substrate-binding protein